MSNNYCNNYNTISFISLNKSNDNSNDGEYDKDDNGK